MLREILGINYIDFFVQNCKYGILMIFEADSSLSLSMYVTYM